MTDALPGLDLTLVEKFLAEQSPGLLRGSLSGELISGGRSNLTYVITDGHARWVLRRPPLGHVLATAHDMGREYRVMNALVPSDVPVPRMVALADSDVIGAPFYVMEFVDGYILRSPEQLRPFSGQRALDMADELVSVLARAARPRPGIRRPGRTRPTRRLPRAAAQALEGSAREVLTAATRVPCSRCTRTCPPGCPAPSARASCTATTGWTTSS